jgi:hypothetical protein
MGQKQPSVPAAPDPSDTYKRGLQIYGKYLPKQLAQEMMYRGQYDPQRIQQQLGLQSQFGPTQYAQQLAALQQFDPQGVAIRNALGADVLSGLGTGEEARKAYQAQLKQQADQGLISQKDYQAQLKQISGKSLADQSDYQSLLKGLSGKSVADQKQFKDYLKQQGIYSSRQQGQLSNYLRSEMFSAGQKRTSLGAKLQSELAAGTKLSPEEQTQAEQSVRAAQMARGNTLGNAPAFAEALTAGRRGQELYQQRVANMQNFLSQGDPQAQQWAQSFMTPNPGMQAYGQSLTMNNPQLAAYGQSLYSPSPQLAQYGQSIYQSSPQLMAYGQYLQTPNVPMGQAGSYLSSPNPMQSASLIQPVSPDRSNQYVNPNAGYQGQQFGQQNYANQLGAYNASLNAPNPWAGALGGAAGGATAGAAAGPYGALAGGVIGGAAGYFGYSDERIKTNIKTVGTSPNGLKIIEWSYNWDRKKRYRGVLAQQVKEMFPDAVKDFHGYLAVDYGHPGVDVKWEEVKEDA